MLDFIKDLLGISRFHVESMLHGASPKVDA